MKLQNLSYLFMINDILIENEKYGKFKIILNYIFIKQV